MTKRMLIDSTHAEETRVVVLDGSRLEDFDVETSTKRQLKGNIYLAKVVRVEPSLQAAFVEYGGNRHGFLAFSEIHPDYYQIPVADRQRLLEMQAEEARREEEEEDLELELTHAAEPRKDKRRHPEPAHHAEREPEPEAWASPALPLLIAPEVVTAKLTGIDAPPADESADEPDHQPAAATAETWARPHTPRLLGPSSHNGSSNGHASDRHSSHGHASNGHSSNSHAAESADEEDDEDSDSYDQDTDALEALPPPETVGGNEHDSSDEQRERRMPPRFMRNYKIQEVIRRRQILLVQVVKEERGTKGAALTTYLSLAGRFGVLMPNSPRGGGISRKITSAADRRRLKEVMAELDIPRGMGLIVRTAGANRPKPEIKRDCEYLLRLWDDIREHTLKSVAPALIYEEASLIKRAIRDVYSRDIDEIQVDGEEGWRAAHDFMRMLMPAHAKKVQLWRDGGQPLFAKYQVEAQLDGMLHPTVQLRSGGYLVINQAEALVAIDVNSGRSTRERNIEETALRTNLEAADEVARQLRLRDLAGLIVIDFIDMESKRHNAMVERRIKEALKNDRARIQVGHISHFGLLEMSRQRLRPSLTETSFISCPHCGGTGHVRSTESAAIHVLRGIEDEGGKRRSAEIVVHVPTPIALYLLNHKRERLREIELRYAMRVIIAADDAQIALQYRIEKLRVRSAEEAPPVVTPDRMLAPMPEPEDDTEEEDDVLSSSAEDDESESEEDSEETGAETSGAQAGEDSDRPRKRRRRRRRTGRRDDQAAGETGAPEGQDAEQRAPEQVADAEQEPVEAVAQQAAEPQASADGPERADQQEQSDGAERADGTERVEGAERADGAERAGDPATEDDGKGRKRGRRGGRRRRRDDGELSPYAEPGAEQPDMMPVYAGPTPADPFGGRAFDIFDVMDQVERSQTSTATPRAPEPSEFRAADVEIVNVSAPEPVSIEPLSGVDPAPAASEATEPAFASAQAVIAEAEAVQTDAVPEQAPEIAAAPVEEPPPPAPEPEPVAEEPEPPPPEPLVKPIMIGAGDEPPAEKKRGWWRR